MRLFLPATLVLLSLSAEAADPPSKRGGGLFGFGAPKKEQISGDLFPDGSSQTGSTAPDSAEKPLVAVPSGEKRPGSPTAAIFREGQPQRVAPVAYVIEDGQKIAQNESDARKRPSLFAFGKRADSVVDTNEIVTPIPTAESAASKPAPIVAAPVPSAPARQAPPVAAPIAAAPEILRAAPASGPAETAAIPNSPKESKFGWVPFLSKRKANEPAPASSSPALAATVATPVETAAVPQTSPATPAAPAAAKPQVAATTTAAASSGSSKPAAGPEAIAADAPPTFEVPRPEPKKEGAKKEETASRESGLLAPIANIRPPRKEIDFSSAETIIQDGEIVASSESTYDSRPTTSSVPSSERQAPQVINGVKTYSSWDDIDARSVSAADRILRQIR